MTDDKSTVPEDRELGICPNTERSVFLKHGRYGPYVQRALREGSKMKPNNAALLKGMSPDEVTLETALKLLALPRIVGKHPDTATDIVAHNGRYGPYIKCGAETRSLPSDLSPIDVSLEQCLLLLAQPKKSRGKGGAKKNIIKILGESPVTQDGVKILSGKFGLYLTDGLTNVTLPKSTMPDEVTLEQALEMLKNKADHSS